jgi:gamma-glutamyltranspeptidase/glutathione hydrolase
MRENNGPRAMMKACCRPWSFSFCLWFIAFLVFLAGIAPSAADPRPAIAQPVLARHGMVVAQEAQAARIGADILRRGGNAVDAAVATGFALAVTYPRAGNIGGGGFMVIHLAVGRRDIAIDYRETAPAATTRDVFLDDKGEADPAKSRDGGLAIGVPGTVAGLVLAHRKYGSGRLTLAQLIAPAISLARDGFVIKDDLADTLASARPLFARWPSSMKVFFRNGAILSEGEKFVQTDLANTLDLVVRHGASGFYEGPVAEGIAKAVRDAGGRMTADDLKSYRALERAPVRGTYRGYEIVSMPPPSSGGVHLIEMLNILEGFPSAQLAAKSDVAAHLIVESMRRAYADRAEFLGDPDFVNVPVKKLTSKDYATRWRATINRDRATPSGQIRAGNPAPAESGNTTHFSVVDRHGNAVSNTYTLNLNYGVGLVADGTGVLLNNELDDFAAKPGAPNAFGMLGGDANAPGPRKRPLSSMTPTIVLKNGKPFLVTGSPGGSRIITATLQIIINVIDRGMNIAEAVTAPRFHHQWLPDQARLERDVPEAIAQSLVKRGHVVTRPLPQTSTNSIMVTRSGLAGAADPRTRGALAAGY